MMADLQDNPDFIPEFLRKWEDGFDVIYAVISKRTSTTLYKRFGALFFYRLMNYFKMD